MKKLIVIAIAGVVGLGLSSPAQANEVDNYPEIPDFCIFDLAYSGPSRAAHGPAETEIDEETPLCSELDICFTDTTPKGPSRLPHGGENTYGDCTDVTDECVLDLPPTGPSRGVHARPGVTDPIVTPTPDPSTTPIPSPEPTVVSGPSVYIEQPCQEQLSLALAPVPGGPVVGSNSTPTILMASALVLTGGLLIVGQRRLARR